MNERRFHKNTTGWGAVDMHPISSSVTRAVVMATLVGALVGVPSAAQAQSVTLPDPRGDMMWIHTPPDDDDDATPPHVLFPAPEQVKRDIIRTRFRHKHARIRVRITFADLRRVGTYNDYTLNTLTNEGQRRELVLYTGPGRWAGEVFTGQFPRDIPCRIHREIDYATNVIIIGFARKCLSYPRWVRFGFGTTGGEESEDSYFYDDSLRRGLRPLTPDSWTLSQRLARGTSTLP